VHLASGDRLGDYEVTGALGAGGMGEVYRARDAKLGRDVALKILPPTFAHDPERVARFHREAQVLAALNHPHIAAIHGLEELNGVQVLVLELVDGETLAPRLQRGPLPVDEAMAVARQIADALGAAHEKGIIHRDLKPANIALSSQDQVKVLDFGLARALEAADGSDTSHSPTLTFHATQAGVILGTAAYMSPEQAKGRAADKRADVFAFGCVLYEMLSGRRAFDGEDVSDTLAAVLRGDPDWHALPAGTPTPVRTLIQQCLAKDRKERVADIAVAAYVLRNPIAAPAGAVRPAAAPRKRLTAAVTAIAAVALVALAGTLGWLLRTPPSVSRSPTRFAIGVPSDQVISEVVRRRHMLALSPDGTRLAYIGNDQIYLRPMDALEAAPIRGSHEVPVELAFSPDGQWIAYYAGGRLEKIPVTGGAPVTLAETPALYGMSWNGDRIFLGAGSRGILEVPANGGVAKTIVEGGKANGLMHGPQLLPDGHTLLFTFAGNESGTDLWSDASIVVQSLTTGERKTLVRGGTDAHYVPSGHLLFARDAVLFATALDVNRLEVRGGTVGVVDQIALSQGPTGAAHVALSDSGSLVHLPTAQGAASTFAWRNRQGIDTPIAAPVHAYDMPRVSPDGRRIALHAIDQDNDIWIWDTVSQTLTRLTFDRGMDSFPLWTVDGKRVVYVSRSSGEPNLYVRPADGTGQAAPLLPKPPDSSGALVGNALTPDGKFLIFSVGTPSNIMMVGLDEKRETRALLNNPQYAERGAAISPDGRWLAYQSDESGSFQVYVRPFPNVDQGRWQISADGGTNPIWAPNGRERYFVDTSNHVDSVPVQAGASFSLGRPVTLLDVSDRPAAVYRNYDIAPDGSKFVVIKESQRARSSMQFIVTVDWFEELKRRVPVR
jgi:serine/threonine-protein kinase